MPTGQRYVGVSTALTATFIGIFYTACQSLRMTVFFATKVRNTSLEATATTFSALNGAAFSSTAPHTFSYAVFVIFRPCDVFLESGKETRPLAVPSLFRGTKGVVSTPAKEKAGRPSRGVSTATKGPAARSPSPSPSFLTKSRLANLAFFATAATDSPDFTKDGLAGRLFPLACPLFPFPFLTFMYRYCRASGVPAAPLSLTTEKRTGIWRPYACHFLFRGTSFIFLLGQEGACPASRPLRPPALA